MIPLNSLIFDLIFEWISFEFSFWWCLCLENTKNLFKNIQFPFNFDQNIHFMHTKIKNQNSWGIVSMQKLIMALVVISRLNMFQMCPILESLGLFNFHDGSQKISKIIKNLQKKNLKKISKNAYKKFFKTFYTSHLRIPPLFQISTPKS